MPSRFLLRTALLWLLVLSAAAGRAQSFFEPLSSAQARVAIPTMAGLTAFVPYQLKMADLRKYLTKAPLEFTRTAAPLPLAIPLPDGTVETFALVESPVLSPALAAQFPAIKTYTGKGTLHAGYTIRLSLTSSGFDAIILGVNGDAVYYTKVSTDPANQLYATYFGRDAHKTDTARPFGPTGKCGTIAPAVDTKAGNNGARLRAETNNTGAVLRTFRLALSATKEFTNQKGSGDVNTAFNAMIGYVNRMNAVYRRELSVAFTLVSDTRTVYTAATDPGFVNSNTGQMIEKNQTVLDGAYGADKYDVGHVLSFSGDGSGEGLAQSSSACTSDKAKGVSSFGTFPAIFDDQTFNHEVGHQFSMSHTFNSSIPVCTTREAKTSVEPGAGTTIMSYGYTCSGTAGNDDYEYNQGDASKPGYQPILNFHTVSYAQAAQYISTLSCFTSTALDNVVPSITKFPANVTIPKSTPFTLSGEATDANTADVLSYSWEGTDIGQVTPDATTLANTAQAPFFRTYAPTSTGTRMFPRLSAILSGTNYAKGDKLPSVGVTTNLRMTVRDNAGGLTYQMVTVTVDGNSGPFLETTNLAGSYAGGSSQTITWSVNNTDAAPINCATVDILLSTDGGLTFPTTLLSATPNDGTEPVTLPSLLTDKARIKIVSSNGIFFDISNANFTITAPAQPIVRITAPDPVASEGLKNGGRQAAPGARVGAADPGMLKFERSSSVGTLVVNYTIGGTATPGEDFATLPTSVTFTDGQSVVMEELDPIDNNEDGEGDETATFSLIDEADYDLDPTEEVATIVIKENNSNTTFSIVGVTKPVCTTLSANQRQLTFGPRYEGLTGKPVTFRVVNEMPASTASGPFTLSLFTDNPAITLNAVQQGTDNEASFVYNWLSACTSSTTVTSTTPLPAIILSIKDVTLVSCQATSATQRQLQFTPQYRGGTNAPIHFSVVNEMMPTMATGPYTLNLFTDNPSITLQAVQGVVTASYVYNWLAACTAATTPTSPTTSFAITSVVMNNCQATSATKRDISITPQYSGKTGQPITFRVVNETSPTTSGGPYMLSLYTDNPVITLKAVQQGTNTEASFVYNWLANCQTPTPTRIGTGELSADLQLQVLGNPARSGRLSVQVLGAAGQSLNLNLLDAQGQQVDTHRVEQAGTQEQHTFEISRYSTGVLLLRATTPTQSQTLRVIKAE
jgi:hypothetical protein